MSVVKTLYGTMPDGRDVHLFTIENNNGVSAGIITYGATLATFNCPDRDGVNGDIIMGFDTLEGHLACTCYCGRTVGRYANRIGDGRFMLGGDMVCVDKNENGITCLHGGGAFSGKDPTKVDRSACYAARYIAKNIVKAGLADKCEVQIAYAIGVAKPVSVMIDTFGTAKVDESAIEEKILALVDLRPAAIIKRFDLRRPIYCQLAAYGHMGREDLGVNWEKTDRVDALKAAVEKLA